MKCTYFKRHLQSLLGLGSFDLVLTLGENKRVHGLLFCSSKRLQRRLQSPPAPLHGSAPSTLLLPSCHLPLPHWLGLEWSSQAPAVGVRAVQQRMVLQREAGGADGAFPLSVLQPHSHFSPSPRGGCTRCLTWGSSRAELQPP